MLKRAGDIALGLLAVAILTGADRGGPDRTGPGDLFTVRARFPLGEGPEIEEAAVGAVVVDAAGVVVLRGGGGGLRGLDLASGQVRWATRGPPGARGRIERAREAVLVAGDDAVVRLAAATGEPLWRWAPGGALKVLAADADGLLVASGELAVLLAARTGEVAWRLHAPGGWESGGLASGHAVLATRGGGLVFVSRARGTEAGRWGAGGDALAAWRVSETGARALVLRAAGSRGGGASAELVTFDALGRERGREALPGAPGATAGGPRVAEVTADGALMVVGAAGGGRAWLLRRFGARTEVVEADGLGAPVRLAGEGGAAAEDGEVLVFPGLRGALWRVVSPGRAAWAVALPGVNGGAGEVVGAVCPMTSMASVDAVDSIDAGERGVGARSVLLVAGDAAIRLDLGLERVIGAGVVDGDGAGAAVAAAWIAGPPTRGGAAGGWPLVVRAREVVAGRATRASEVLANLSEFEARGGPTEASKARRGLLDRFGVTGDAPRAGALDVSETGATASTASTARASAVCVGRGCGDPLAMSDAEVRRVAGMREAWLAGDAASVTTAAAEWLGREPRPEVAAPRVAAGLGWLLLDVAVAVDGAPPAGVVALAKAAARVRAGLPWLERAVWALVAARAGAHDAAADLLDALDAPALGVTARRAAAARALKGLRDAAGAGADAGRRLADGLAGFGHIDALYGSSAGRVRALVGRLATDPKALAELDDHAHGLGLHLVGRGAMEVELCALGCELLATRCGADHLEDACVTRCATTGAVRLAAVSRAAETGPGWYCGP
jgi:hypothetical protein